jgi:hypothetical protein
MLGKKKSPEGEKGKDYITQARDCPPMIFYLDKRSHIFYVLQRVYEILETSQIQMWNGVAIKKDNGVIVIVLEKVN